MTGNMAKGKVLHGKKEAQPHKLRVSTHEHAHAVAPCEDSGR